jgi:hypothetical protein
LFLGDNLESELIVDVYTHHHGQDGVMIDGLNDRRARSQFENVTCEYNGRQGVSIVGGTGYDFSNCKFRHTGRSVITSAPGAGVDIEAEDTKTVRDLTFTGCLFEDNAGCGLLADSGDSRGATFTRCTFIGTTAWSAWPRKPFFRFNDCVFVGALVQAPVEADLRLRAYFVGCTFTDDPERSPTRKVFLGHGANGPIADLNEAGNPVFIKCTFTLVAGGQLPWSLQATYQDCTMRQASPLQAYPRGTYLGRSTIVGFVDLYSSRILGELRVNGKLIERNAG